MKKPKKFFLPLKCSSRLRNDVVSDRELLQIVTIYVIIADCIKCRSMPKNIKAEEKHKTSTGILPYCDKVNMYKLRCNMVLYI